MAQYHELKQQHEDGILFFQVGDFYETFYDDAIEVSNILNITLTSRDKKNPVPLAGVPIHAADAYVAKLLKAGKKVVICDQVQDSSEAKGLVKRAVTDVITPGTSLSPATLPEKKDHYIASIIAGEESMAFALLSVSTGDFVAGEESKENVENLIGSSEIHEAILPVDRPESKKLVSRINPGCSLVEIEEYYFGKARARDALLNQFNTENLAGFGIEDRPIVISAAGALLSYVRELRRDRLTHISKIRLIASSETLFIDRETSRNLELFESLRGESLNTTLIKHIDRTMTASGARLLRSWIMRPSRDIRIIESRQNGVAAFLADQSVTGRIRKSLAKLPDIERIVSRISTGKATPREVLQLLEVLRRVPEISSAAGGLQAEIIASSLYILNRPTGVTGLIESSIREETPPNLREGGVIKKGYDQSLDRLIEESDGGKRWIARLQKTEREKTGIPSLKVGFNKVFGYYIEVSNTHAEKVPQRYIEKQTLVSSRRYITGDLKEKESSVLSADARRVELEKKIFAEVCGKIAESSAGLQETARAAATLDVLSSLADLALKRDYCRPAVNESDDLIITGGRHPVVEIISKKNFIPNDILLRPSTRQVIIITGPNMGGKSTIIRQTALISILAHAGSYVPASKADVGIMDRIFTRVGSSDNLAHGESTFLVEMSETANILNNCTTKSLVLLDEVGRGTSTSDGLSIARAVTEFLMDNDLRRPKTLFATHYHELTELEKNYPRIHNMRVAIKEWNDEIIFLYKLLDGKTDKSYGIHVAKLAGLPDRVIIRANEILESIENGSFQSRTGDIKTDLQPSLFKEEDPLRKMLEGIDVNKLTPLEAIQILAKLQKLL